MSKTTITFDESASEIVIDLMAYHERNKNCQFCNEKITVKNVGGFNQLGAFCKKLSCLLKVKI